MTLQTEDGGFCLWGSETHCGMPERAFGDCARLAMGCVGKDQCLGKEGSKVGWGGTWETGKRG